jgi:hypothetical protein
VVSAFAAISDTSAAADVVAVADAYQCYTVTRLLTALLLLLLLLMLMLLLLVLPLLLLLLKLLLLRAYTAMVNDAYTDCDTATAGVAAAAGAVTVDKPRYSVETNAQC